MTRRLITIPLILLLAFNWFGYRLVMDCLEQAATVNLQSRLDKQQYDEASLVELRVPLNMPYMSDWDEFQSYEGETTINGIHYRYVKRKVEKGELVLLCIPNQQKTDLQKAKHDFFKLVNDLQQPGKKDSKESNSKLSISDCIADNSNGISFPVTEAPAAHPQYARHIADPYDATPAQPPEA